MTSLVCPNTKNLSQHFFFALKKTKTESDLLQSDVSLFFRDRFFLPKCLQTRIVFGNYTALFFNQFLCFLNFFFENTKKSELIIPAMNFPLNEKPFRIVFDSANLMANWIECESLCSVWVWEVFDICSRSGELKTCYYLAVVKKV